MRLWHEKLLPIMSDQRLLGQHRECCAMRGRGWGRKHSTVDYVWGYNYMSLYHYHRYVMIEMLRRDITVSGEWWDYHYRGKTIGCDVDCLDLNDKIYCETYPRHNDIYLQECIDLLFDRDDFELKHRILSEDERFNMVMDILTVDGGEM